ncbi:AMP-binding protein [uncultured Sphingomonas sp.]|uniref:AMP-binding protein n=1 Tax=uncultured Sphingomonas sp. TaxID=158754 RepID=UPI0025F2413C|nr:AMP-binding protein [uncultured Sphingomonas sp.]
MSVLLDAIRRHAAARPDAVAIDGPLPMTWVELATLIPPLAEDLRRRFPHDRPVAVRIDHGTGPCLLDLALVEAELPVVPLPRFFTEAQVEHALLASGAQALIDGPVKLADEAVRLDFAATYADRLDAAIPAGTARITFTSGSTGEPKGICLSLDHLAAVAGAVVATLGAQHAGRHLPLLPPGILLENVAGYYAGLIAGGTYVPLEQAAVGMGDPFRPVMRRMLDAIIGQRITSLILVPELLAGLVAAMQAVNLRLPQLTLVAVGGARVPPALLDAATALGLPVRQGYGLTECASVVTLDDGTAPGSVGRSIGVNAIRIADDGEVMLEGPVTLGIAGAPRAAGPLATGDIGRLDEDGRLWIEGRKSARIITSHGRNISPEWVEGALLATGAAAQVMVRGEGRAALDALIVPARPDADIAAAVAAANAGLPAYARIGAWRVVPPFLPAAGLLTGNGRLRRAAIDAAYPYEESSVNQPFFQRLIADTREAQARFAMTPQLQAGLTGRISRADYIAYLTQAYHHVRHTVPLMQAARERLAHKPMLVEALDDYIEEETGHEHWILDDIAAAGGDRYAAEWSDMAPATAAMVDHAYRTIRHHNPAAFFGMVFVLEGTSIALASNGASAVQRTLGLPDGAFRYLTSHGALDQDHMKFFEKLMNRIDDPADQQAIVDMANAMFALFGGVFASIELEGDREAA